MGQVSLARMAKDHLRDRGSITLTTGVLAMHPILPALAATLKAGPYERRALAGIINKYWRIRADSLTDVCGWLRSFIGYLLVGP
jgi:hypothetical protein